jgi:hypothetical protein
MADAICYGNAKPDDVHLAADIVAIDNDIIAWLKRPERRKRRKHRWHGHNCALPVRPRRRTDRRGAFVTISMR